MEYEVEWEWRWEPFADMYEADEIARPVQIPEIDVGDVEAYKFEFKKEVEQ